MSKKSMYIWTILCILSMIMLAGCSFLQSKPDPLPIPGPGLVTKLIVQNNWLLTFSIVGVGAGFFAFLNGNSKGLSIMASCFVVAGLILSIANYAAWIAAIFMIGAIALMLYTILTRKIALKEVIETVEDMKSQGDTEGIIEWFPDYIKENVQSPSTTKLVKSIKKGLK